MYLDNAYFDNKNNMNCFWLVYVTHAIFKEIIVIFLIGGHAHDNVDAIFDRKSIELTKENSLTVQDIMTSLMVIDKFKAMIPHSI